MNSCATQVKWDTPNVWWHTSIQKKKKIKKNETPNSRVTQWYGTFRIYAQKKTKNPFSRFSISITKSLARFALKSLNNAICLNIHCYLMYAEFPIEWCTSNKWRRTSGCDKEETAYKRFVTAKSISCLRKKN